MSDDKEIYHRIVLEQKELAQHDEKLARGIKAGHARKERFGANWQKINIVEMLARFAPGARARVNADGTKVIWSNPELQIDVICDVGGGSLRLQDMSVVGKQKRPRYLDINGKVVRTTAKGNGKQRGLTKEEQQALTHFLIMTREEMNENE